MTREFTGHSKHPLPTTQEKTLHMNITRWSTLKVDRLQFLQPKMEKLYIVSKKKKRLGVDHGSDHELLTAKFRLKLNKVGEITRQFRYQISSVQSLSYVQFFMIT